MVILASIVAELLIYMPFLWRSRRIVTCFVLFTLLASLCLLLIRPVNDVFHILAVTVIIFRIISLCRILKARMHETYLHNTTRRSSFYLIAIQVLVFGASYIFGVLPVNKDLLIPLGWTQLLVAVSLFGITLRNTRKIRRPNVVEYYADRDLPTLSVLVPARNETEDLELCIQSLLANDYPKLEIIVLDDCSHDNTADIIKKFAHDGVRFVRGLPPEERWLAKNQAYQQLSEEATGEYLLFCGVDSRFGGRTLRELMTLTLNKQKDMLSVLPRRLISNGSAALIQPMRYWWELVLPRRLFNRPAVLSTCWLIKSKTLQHLGGFNAVSHTILPEGYFARELVKKDSYSFVRSDEVVDVQTNKQLSDQRDTTVRMRYPQLHKRPELVILVSGFEIIFLLGPCITLMWALIIGVTMPTLLVFVVAQILLILVHVIILQITDPANVLLGLVNFPLAVLTELFLGYESMFRYEFGKIDWKGRNVCIPVMHVIPHLPRLVDKS